MKPITIHRIKIATGIAAAAVTVGGGLLALASAHGDLVHRLERVEERMTHVESVDEKLDAMREQLGEIKAELRVVRQFFRIPAEVTP
ncbi:MAG: hypothetical protein IT379_39920 [Deltaproteobacteria bacterium]|nr:hypothetical protein [Deltaproteobacteria bacterium]